MIKLRETDTVAANVRLFSFCNNTSVFAVQLTNCSDELQTRQEKQNICECSAIHSVQSVGATKDQSEAYPCFRDLQGCMKGQLDAGQQSKQDPQVKGANAIRIARVEQIKGW